MQFQSAVKWLTKVSFLIDAIRLGWIVDDHFIAYDFGWHG
jgi:hypothetical protein